MHWQCAKKYAADAETQMELALAMETVRWLVCVVCLAALRPPLSRSLCHTPSAIDEIVAQHSERRACSLGVAAVACRYITMGTCKN